MSFKRCMCVSGLVESFFLVDGDVRARKTTSKERDVTTKKPSCLVRLKKDGESSKSKSLSVSLDLGSADLFQKRLNQLVKMQMLRTKPRKSRSGSQ